MKKLILSTLFLVLLFSGIAWAQPGGGADLDAIRVGYITKKLSLTADEAKLFWPVYDAYKAELKAVRLDQREVAKAAKEDFDTMSDKEVEAAIDDMLGNRRKELDITMRYHEEFKKVLPIRKGAKLYRAELEFTQLLIERLQNAGANGGGPRSNGGRPGGMRRY